MSEPTTLADALEELINNLEQKQGRTLQDLKEAQNRSYRLGSRNATRRAIELIEDAIVTTCHCRTCHKLEALAEELREQEANL